MLLSQWNQTFINHIKKDLSMIHLPLWWAIWFHSGTIYRLSIWVNATRILLARWVLIISCIVIAIWLDLANMAVQTAIGISRNYGISYQLESPLRSAQFVRASWDYWLNNWRSPVQIPQVAIANCSTKGATCTRKRSKCDWFMMRIVRSSSKVLTSWSLEEITSQKKDQDANIWIIWARNLGKWSWHFLGGKFCRPFLIPRTSSFQ